MTLSFHKPISPQVDVSNKQLPTCAICSEEIGAIRADGSTETEYKLPCSHNFGSICIVRWLQDSVRQDCPQCRRRMVHKGCGHLVMPHEAKAAPPTILESEMPEQCLRCRGEGVVSRALSTEYERILAAEKSLRSMQVHLPRIFGSLATISLLNVDQRIDELRKSFAAHHEKVWRDFEENERRERW